VTLDKSARRAGTAPACWPGVSLVLEEEIKTAAASV